MAEWSRPVDDGTEYAGADIVNSSQPNFEACKTFCNNTPGCNSVSYNGSTCYAKTWKYPLALGSKLDTNGCSTDMVKKTCVGTGWKSQLRYNTTTTSATTDQLLTTFDSTGDVQSVIAWYGRNNLCSDYSYFNEADDPYRSYLKRGACIDLRTDEKLNLTCPDWGLISNVVFSRQAGSTDTTALPDRATCVYNTIDSSKASWDLLATKFSGTQLTNAQKLFCGINADFATVPDSNKIAIFDKIWGTTDCKNQNSIDWKTILLNLIASVSGWYNNTDWCKRFGDLIQIIISNETPPYTDNVHGAALDRCLNTIRNDRSFMAQTWSTDLKTALNKGSNAGTEGKFDAVANRIKNLVTDHCNAMPNKGTGAIECGCKNAIEGWATPSGCVYDSTTKVISGCADVNVWQNIMKDLGSGNPGTLAVRSIQTITDTYKPHSMAAACVNTQASASEILAYGTKETSASGSIQICNQNVSATDAATISAQNINLTCANSSSNTQSAQNAANTPPSPPGTPGSPSGDGKILGLEPWLFYTLLGVVILVILGGGAAAFFLL